MSPPFADLDPLRAETQTAASDRELLEAAFDGVLMAAARRDSRNRIVDLEWAEVSAGAMCLLRLPANQLIGTSCKAVLTEWGIKDGMARLIEVLSSGKPDRFEITTPDIRVLDTQIMKHADGVAMLCRDITEQRRTQRRVRELEEQVVWTQHRMHEVLDGNSDPFAMFDAEDRLVLCNKSWLDMADREPLDTLLGQRFEDILRSNLKQGVLGDQDEAEIEAFITWRMENHFARTGEPFQVARGDGRVFMFRENPTRDGGVLTAASDITEVERARALMDQALESVDQAFALYDRNDRLVIWNSKFARRIRPVDLHEGMDFTVIARDAAHNVVRLLDMDGQEISLDERIARHHAMTSGLEFERHHDDGRVSLIRERRLPDGSIALTSTTVTELKRKEEALAAKVEELAKMAKLLTEEKERAEAANHTKSQFLANMSHELRTPLNAVLGFSEILKMQAFGPLGADRYRAYADDIHTSGSHLLSLINDLLDMSKIEAGKYTLHKEPCPIGDILDAVKRIIHGRADDAELRLRINPVDPEMLLSADPRAIKQVLINLLANAIKFTPKGGVVELVVEAADSTVEIRVHDNGIGMPTTAIPRLLKPFEQIDDPGNNSREGSGLGLALSNALVELHGGTLQIDSTEGAGTTVTVRLPR